MVTLAAYLAMAVRIFESDKVAYVFDSTSGMSGAVAAQVKAQLNAVLTVCKPFFQDYLLSGSEGGRRFSLDTERNFRQEPLMDLLVVYKRSETGDFDVAAVLEKEAGQADAFIEKMKPELKQDLMSVVTQGRAMRSPFGDDRAVLFEKFGDAKETTIFVVVARLSEISEMFRTVLSQKLYLIDRGGTILFGPRNENAKNLSDELAISFLKDPAAVVVQGAETATDGAGAETLASYSKVGFGDLVVVSTVGKDKALGAVAVLLRKSLIFFVILICLTVMVSLFASGTITQALSALFDATQKVSEGHFDIRVNVKSNDEVGALADNFNIMAEEVARLLGQTAEKARMESELQTAKTVQETLFPETRKVIDGLQIAGFYEPASECGGDWWHYCKVGDRVFLWIGDATGHGAPAALITSAAKSAATIIESLNVGPGEALSFLNKAICEVARGRLMMTFFVAAYDSKAQTLTYSNASHEAPLLIRKTSGPPKKKDLQPLLEVNHPRLGESKDTVYAETVIQLELGDTIFFYTDGVPDIQSPAAEPWGERDFLKAVIATQKESAAAGPWVDRFVKTFQSFRQGSQLKDDVTFFVVKNEPLEGFDGQA